MANRRRNSRGEVSPEDKKKVTRDRLRQAYPLLRFVKPYRVWLFWGMVALLLSTLTSLALPYFLGLLVNAALPGTEGDIPGGPMSGSMPDLSKFLPVGEIDQIAILLIIILVLQAVFSFARIYCFAQVSQKGVADVRHAVYAKILTLPIFFFDQRRVGELTNRIAADVTQLQEVLSLIFPEFIRQLLTLVAGIFILVLLVSSQLTIYMLAFFPVLAIAAMFFGRTIRKLSKKAQDQLAEANVVVEETFQSIRVVKAFANELLESIRYKTALGKVVDTTLKAESARGVFVSFLIIAVFSGVVLIIWLGAKMVNNGLINVGDLFSFVLYTAFIVGSLVGIGNFYSQLQKTIGASERVREILGEESELVLPEEGQNTERNLAGEIIFENVVFSYPSRPEVEVLSDINLEVQSGEKIALVGHSGAGKSTITQLMLRFYYPKSGEIRVDGKNINEYELNYWRNQLALVPQEVMLFGGTIGENISYGKPNASLEEIQEAAEKANAWEFISQFPEGLNTVVGERGIKLSGGQRQRVAIARAILKDPAILILDEATSSLDAGSEKLVQEALNELMIGRTTIVIAHRLSTIREVNRIYVIDEGQIKESGTHQELSIRSEGLYSNLLKLQLAE